MGPGVTCARSRPRSAPGCGTSARAPRPSASPSPTAARTVARPSRWIDGRNQPDGTSLEQTSTVPPKSRRPWANPTAFLFARSRPSPPVNDDDKERPDHADPGAVPAWASVAMRAGGTRPLLLRVTPRAGAGQAALPSLPAELPAAQAEAC